MNMEIGTEAAQFPEKEYINGIFVAVYNIMLDWLASCLLCVVQSEWLERQRPGIPGDPLLHHHPREHRAQHHRIQEQDPSIELHIRVIAYWLFTVNFSLWMVFTFQKYTNMPWNEGRGIRYNLHADSYYKWSQLKDLLVAGVLDDLYSQLTPLSGVAVQARQST